ncbi:glyoxalase [Solimonas sp. K1W22B-7]|uniref:VOC family protein n=1 Tax=Solimonas sp. K1W22B-7 TaxID=2303331 RepID=UPI000E334EEE|nr:VOC family protein [Solimonas sp. K1W22B-7]AXQ27404.1 glyoxalase [Solimonas sp. K1W22B-7]
MRHLYPIVTTPDLARCRSFYVDALGASVLFEQDWYLHLSVDGWEIGFLHPSHPRRLPVFAHTALTRGLCLALEVEDVRALHDRLAAKGVDILGRIGEHPGGELSFSVMDPAGTVLNVVQLQGGGEFFA